MVRNNDRRAALADAGIRIIAEEGARGLTHRAVDVMAGTPSGTASNYFPSRDLLIEALVHRIGERLTPDPEVVEAAEKAAGIDKRALFTRYLHDLVSRLSANPQVTLALFELRLEAARRPAVAKTLGAWRQQAFLADVEFNANANLPGGKAEIVLFHYAIDGLMLDLLTVPLETGLDVDEAVQKLASRLLT